MTTPARVPPTARTQYTSIRARKTQVEADPDMMETLDNPKKALTMLRTMAQSVQAQTAFTQTKGQLLPKIRILEEHQTLGEHLQTRAKILDTIGLFCADQAEQQSGHHKDQFTKAWKTCAYMANHTDTLREQDKNLHKQAQQTQTKDTPIFSTPITPRRVTKGTER